MDSSNEFEVVLLADGRVQEMKPPRGPISPERAIVRAAWLVAMADPEAKEFHRVLAEIKSS